MASTHYFLLNLASCDVLSLFIKQVLKIYHNYDVQLHSKPQINLIKSHFLKSDGYVCVPIQAEKSSNAQRAAFNQGLIEDDKRISGKTSSHRLKQGQQQLVSATEKRENQS